MPALKPKPQEQAHPPQKLTPANEGAESESALKAASAHPADDDWDNVVIKDEDQCDPDDIDSWWTWPEEDLKKPGHHVATLREK